MNPFAYDVTKEQRQKDIIENEKRIKEIENVK